MTYLLLQTFLLLLASYFLGAFIACLVRRTFFAARAAAVARGPIPAVVVPATVAGSARAARRVQIAPRAFDPVQPRIEIFKRPEPRPMPKLVDPSRFERALLGPDPNEGVPRKPIVELRPAVLKSPTNVTPRPASAPTPTVQKPAAPPAKPATPTPAPPLAKIVAQEVAREQRDGRGQGSNAPPPRPADATTASAAAAVAASKAAAAASVTPSAPLKVEPKQPAPSAPTPVQAKPPAAPPPAPPQTAPDAPAAFRLPDPPITEGDDLQRIRAIDFLTEQKLKSIGVLYFDHIAGWSVPDVRRIGQTLDILGRIDREQWIEQAQILAKGGETYYSRNRAASLNQKAGGGSSAASADAPDKPAADVRAAPEPSLSVAAAPGAKTPSGGDSPSGAAQGFAAQTSGKSVAELAQAAAAAIAAASASVTRGLRPIEPISPLSKVDPKISIPAKLSDAIKERAAPAPASGESDDVPTSPAAAKAQGPLDDLKRIRGIGVLIEKRLNGAGVTRYEHIASWTGSDVDRFSRMLEFKGRIERENWIEQARILANGGQTEFSGRVDRGEIDTSKDS